MSAYSHKETLENSASKWMAPGPLSPGHDARVDVIAGRSGPLSFVLLLLQLGKGDGSIVC